MFELMKVFADGEVPAAGAAAGAEGAAASPLAMFGTFIPLILMIAVFYFILIRPQRKKDKELRAMIADLKMGDEVVTIGGIHGKIFRIKDDTFVLESGAGTNKSYIQVDRSSVSRLVKQADNSKKVTPIPDADPFGDQTEEENQ